MQPPSSPPGVDDGQSAWHKALAGLVPWTLVSCIAYLLASLLTTALARSQRVGAEEEAMARFLLFIIPAYTITRAVLAALDAITIAEGPRAAEDAEGPGQEQHQDRPAEAQPVRDPLTALTVGPAAPPRRGVVAVLIPIFVLMAAGAVYPLLEALGFDARYTWLPWWLYRGLAVTALVGTLGFVVLRLFLAQAGLAPRMEDPIRNILPQVCEHCGAAVQTGKPSRRCEHCGALYHTACFDASPRCAVCRMPLWQLDVVLSSTPIVEARSGQAGGLCPYCQTRITPTDAWVLCPECRTPHHYECWHENGGCTTYGCKLEPAG